MRIILISTLLLIISANISFGQKNTYALSAGVGNGLIMKQQLDGGPSYDLNTGISIGLQYCRKLTDKLHLMTAINFYKNSVSVTPNFYPGIDMTPKDYDVQLMYIPVFLKVSLSKYFFIHGGLIGDFDITKEKYITSQSGLGAGVGIGTEISLTNKLAIQLNPYLNFHGLLLAKGETYAERIFESGIKLNLILKK